jgi:hypothetical protein
VGAVTEWVGLPRWQRTTGSSLAQLVEGPWEPGIIAPFRHDWRLEVVPALSKIDRPDGGVARAKRVPLGPQTDA